MKQLQHKISWDPSRWGARHSLPSLLSASSASHLKPVPSPGGRRRHRRTTWPDWLYPETGRGWWTWEWPWVWSPPAALSTIVLLLGTSCSCTSNSWRLSLSLLYLRVLRQSRALIDGFGMKTIVDGFWQLFLSGQKILCFLCLTHRTYGGRFQWDSSMFQKIPVVSLCCQWASTKGH